LSGQQAIEKHLKCALLLGNETIKRYHNIKDFYTSLIAQTEESPPVIVLTEYQQEISNQPPEGLRLNQDLDSFLECVSSKWSPASRYNEYSLLITIYD